MFDLRLKRAEVALSAGRLDEACDVLDDPKLKAHRKGQKLISHLCKAFIQRGRQHLEAQRTAAALEDCNRAEKLGGNLADVTELRSMICEQIQSDRLHRQQEAEQLNKAQQQIQKGWLSTGRKMLEESNDHQQAGVLLKNAALQQVETDSAAKRIEKALKHGQIELAGRIYQGSALHDSMSDEAVLLLSRIQQQAADKIRTSLQQGDVNSAVLLLNGLNATLCGCEQIIALQQAVSYCQQAADHIQSGQFAQAAGCLRKTQLLVPKAPWVKQSLEHIQRAQKATEELQSGALGILEAVEAYEPKTHKPAIQQKNTLPSPRFAKQSVDMAANDNNQITQFLLQLDGIGAYYVYCADRVTIGPISSSARSDIEVVAAPDVQIKQIQRFEEDYILSDVSHSKTTPAAQQLLGDGGRVELSPRCRFKFTVPNPASSTACLVPSSAKFPRADVNGAILMKREILIGPARNCHIQTGQVSETITLYLQDGQIRCRSAEAITVDKRPVSAHNGLPMNQPIEVGAIRMTLTTRQH